MAFSFSSDFKRNEDIFVAPQKVRWPSATGPAVWSGEVCLPIRVPAPGGRTHDGSPSAGQARCCHALQILSAVSHAAASPLPRHCSSPCLVAEQAGSEKQRDCPGSHIGPSCARLQPCAPSAAASNVPAISAFMGRTPGTGSKDSALGLWALRAWRGACSNQQSQQASWRSRVSSEMDIQRNGSKNHDDGGRILPELAFTVLGICCHAAVEKGS